MRFDSSEKSFIKILIEEKLAASEEIRAMHEWALELSRRVTFLENKLGWQLEEKKNGD